MKNENTTILNYSTKIHFNKSNNEKERKKILTEIEYKNLINEELKKKKKFRKILLLKIYFLRKKNLKKKTLGMCLV